MIFCLNRQFENIKNPLLNFFWSKKGASSFSIKQILAKFGRFNLYFTKEQTSESSVFLECALQIMLSI